METIRRQSLVESTAEHLRQGFRKGQWRGLLPGVRTLADELDVSKDTVRAALQLLENEGSLQSNGAGKCRRITARRTHLRKSLRIGILLPNPLKEDNSHSQRMISELKHSLEVEGHACVLLEQPMGRTGDLRCIARMVRDAEVDACVVYAGTFEVFQWFVSRHIPVIALGGRTDGLPVPSTRTHLVHALEQSVDQLVALGHRRIILIANARWRNPTPSINTLAVLKRLEHHGIAVTDYHVPTWEETPAGLRQLLTALFFATPPTALLCAEPAYTVAAIAFLAELGLQVPRDVSLINLLPDPVLQLCTPEIASFVWPETEHVQRILRWIRSRLSGREDLAQVCIAATFVPGGSIAPVKKLKS